MKVSDLRSNQGITGEIDGQEVAVADCDGELKVFENICTHRQCPLEWNAEETVWDCPCHGSRFSADGEVIKGPAIAPLKALSYEVADGEIKLIK